MGGEGKMSTIRDAASSCVGRVIVSVAAMFAPCGCRRLHLLCDRIICLRGAPRGIRFQLKVRYEQPHLPIIRSTPVRPDFGRVQGVTVLGAPRPQRVTAVIDGNSLAHPHGGRPPAHPPGLLPTR